MSETPPADPVAAEDSLYAAIVSEYRGLRRNGAGIIEAAVLTAAQRIMIALAGEAREPGLLAAGLPEQPEERPAEGPAGQPPAERGGTAPGGLDVTEEPLPPVHPVPDLLNA